MQTLISANDFYERFDIDDIDSKRITPHIGAASRRLRKWVGDDVYTNALSEDTTYEDLQADLKNAEAHLTYHFAIFGMNSPLSSKGVLITATATEGKEVRRYLSPKETAELAQHFLDLALEIAAPYMSADDPFLGFEGVTDETCAEASTRTDGGSCC